MPKAARKSQKKEPNVCLTCTEQEKPFDEATGTFGSAEAPGGLLTGTLPQFDPSEVQEDATILFIGKRRTGKSTFLRWVLSFIKQHFPLVVVMTKTPFNGFWQEHVPDDFVHQGVNPVLIEKLMERQKDFVERERAFEQGLSSEPVPNYKAVLVLDDCAADRRAMRHEQLLDELFMNGRHFKLFIAITLQYCKVIPPGIRDNADWIVCFSLKSLNSRMAVWESFANEVPKKEFFAMLDRVAVGFNALVIDTDPHKDVSQRFLQATAEVLEGFPLGSEEMRRVN